MKKQAKNIALLGVSSALLMGIFLTTLPTMAVGPTSSVNVEVELLVTGENPDVKFAESLDGKTVIGKKIPIKSIYNKSKKLDYRLIHIDKNGVRTPYNLPTKNVANGTEPANGTDNFTLDVKDYGNKYGNYILEVKVNGDSSTTDSISFTLKAFDFSVSETEGKENNPVVDIPNSPEVDHVLIQVFDKDGKAIFDEPISSKLIPGNNTKIPLPLSEYGVTEGDYKIIATPYDKNGNIIDENRVRTIHYTPAKAPEVPDTGSFFGSDTFTKADMISTILAIFIACSFFGILIITKKSKKSNR